MYGIGWYSTWINTSEVLRTGIPQEPISVSFCRAASWAKQSTNKTWIHATATWAFDRTGPAIGVRVFFDDHVSLGVKYAAVRQARWSGVAIWLANGMFANGPAHGLEVFTDYCPDDLRLMWQSIKLHFIEPLKTDDSDAAAYDSGADLTGPWRLFVDDDEVLNRSSSVQRKYGQFAKHASNPVMNGSLHGSVLRTAGGGFAMYHECGTTVSFANSTDGIAWMQPTGEVKKQFGTKADVLLTRLGSADKANQKCTAALGCLPAKSCVPAECRDTQPSVLYTPWERNATFQMFNFNYGHATGCKSACTGDDSSKACHACMVDGYYRATSSDGLIFMDDVVSPEHTSLPGMHLTDCMLTCRLQAHNPVVPTNPPHQYLLRRICMHGLDPESGGKCGNDYVYILAGVGTVM